jgi:hypothetical protein
LVGKQQAARKLRGSKQGILYYMNRVAEQFLPEQSIVVRYARKG